MLIGMVGLGRMGANMTRRLLRGGHKVVVSDRTVANVQQLTGEGATGSSSLDDLVANLVAPRVVWLMIPAGDPTETNGCGVGRKAAARGHHHLMEEIHISRMMCGGQRCWRRAGLSMWTSGQAVGVGAGARILHDAGRAEEVVETLDPIFKTLAPGRGEIPVTPGREQNRGNGGGRICLLRALRSKGIL